MRSALKRQPSVRIARFIRAIQRKEEVTAPPLVGQQAAISGHMATLSFKNNKKIIWDEEANKYHFA